MYKKQLKPHGIMMLFVIILLLQCGCVTKTPPSIIGTQYAASGEVVAGRPDTMTTYDIISSTKLLMNKMLTNHRYAKEYEAAKLASGNLPLLVIGNIDPLFEDERVQDRLDLAGETIRTMLYDSEMFDIKDDDANDAIVARITSGMNDGEDDSGFQKEGKPQMPDFMVIGDVKKFKDTEGHYIYRLRIALHSIRTRKILWEGTQSMTKF